MASPPTTEASEVRRRGRQRLIGAIALVAVLVVFVPMILDSEPRTQRDQPALAIPPKTNAPPLPAPPKAAPAAPAKAGAQSPETAPAPAPASEPAKAPAKPAEPAPAPARTAEVAKVDKVEPKASEPAKPAKATPAAASVPAPKLEGFAVQVGAFRDEAKLDQARQKLGAAKVPHYTERLDSKGGPLTRLRAGPFPTREAAESALATLKRSALDGKVVALP